MTYSRYVRWTTPIMISTAPLYNPAKYGKAESITSMWRHSGPQERKVRPVLRLRQLSQVQLYTQQVAVVRKQKSADYCLSSRSPKISSNLLPKPSNAFYSSSLLNNPSKVFSNSSEFSTRPSTSPSRYDGSIDSNSLR